MFENDAQLGETVVKDEVPNLKNFDQRLRDEAHEDISLEVPQGILEKTFSDSRSRTIDWIFLDTPLIDRYLSLFSASLSHLCILLFFHDSVFDLLLFALISGLGLFSLLSVFCRFSFF